MAKPSLPRHSLKRYRARIDGGYCRKTLSFPEDLIRRIEAHLRTKPGLTMSAFVSEKLEGVLSSPRQG